MTERVLNRAGLGAAPVTAVLGVSLGVDIFAVIGGRGVCLVDLRSFA
jgi:hypothetical protein